MRLGATPGRKTPRDTLPQAEDSGKRYRIHRGRRCPEASARGETLRASIRTLFGLCSPSTRALLVRDRQRRGARVLASSLHFKCHLENYNWYRWAGWASSA